MGFSLIHVAWKSNSNAVFAMKKGLAGTLTGKIDAGHWAKKQAGLVTGLLKRRNLKSKLQSDCPFSAQGAHGSNAKRQQHQGTSHNR
jgi:hypothetical protein